MVEKVVREADEEAAMILRWLMIKHPFIQLDNKNYDVWDEEDAAELVADLIIYLNKASSIQDAHALYDWGK